MNGSPTTQDSKRAAFPFQTVLSLWIDSRLWETTGLPGTSQSLLNPPGPGFERLDKEFQKCVLQNQGRGGDLSSASRELVCGERRKRSQLGGKLPPG